jgi:hypothetical protein
MTRDVMGAVAVVKSPFDLVSTKMTTAWYRQSTVKFAIY